MRNTPVKKIFSLFLSFLFAMTLAACNGGGGSDAGGAFGSGGGAGGGGTGGGTGGPTGATTGISIGNFDASNSFQKGKVGVGQSPLAAGGSSSLSVAFVDANGVPASETISVTFLSICLAQGKAEIRDAGGAVVDTATTVGGGANVTYVAKGCTGTDTITARATIGEDVLEAKGSIDVLAATVGGLQFISATPDVIGIKGTGILPESAQIVFQVNDSSGSPASGKTVNFVLDTTVGGITLSTSAATSGSDGRVTTVVSSGTQAVSVRVRASTMGGGGTALVSESDALAITTGIADANSFSTSVVKLNVQGLNFDGETNGINIRAADAANNIVPDGFNVNFTTEAGAIVGSCKTGSAAGPQGQPESGACSVEWRSQDPRPGDPSIAPTSPADGRNSVLASALGVESFIDQNGNGRFDDGEFFEDLGEPFRDDNEDGIFNLGEFFIDFNNNGLRDGPNGLYTGLLCDGPTLCDPNQTLAIGETISFVVSGSVPFITLVCPAFTAASETQICTATVSDVNGNPLAEGTTVALSGTTFSVGAPSSYDVPDASFPGPGTTQFNFLVTSPAACPASDNLVIEVKVPAPGGNTFFGSTPVSCP